MCPHTQWQISKLEGVCDLNSGQTSPLDVLMFLFQGRRNVSCTKWNFRSSKEREAKLILITSWIICSISVMKPWEFNSILRLTSWHACIIGPEDEIFELTRSFSFWVEFRQNDHLPLQPQVAHNSSHLPPESLTSSLPSRWGHLNLKGKEGFYTTATEVYSIWIQINLDSNNYVKIQTPALSGLVEIGRSRRLGG